MMAAAAAGAAGAGGGANQARQVDALAEEAKAVFVSFLEEYHEGIEDAGDAGSDDEGDLGSSDAGQGGGGAGGAGGAGRRGRVRVYVEAARQMEEHAFLQVDFRHVGVFNTQLSEVLTSEFYRLEPHLTQAAQTFCEKYMPETSYADERNVCLSFVNFPHTSGLRELKTAQVGKLMAISGTVTRTSEVRPELVAATFKCLECEAVVPNVAQQFQFTQPSVCSNSTCDNRTAWQLDTSESRFVDWQKVRVQENSSEIPAGSMPRSIDVVLRRYIVESAKPGDKCVFIGTLVVVPDVAQLSSASTQAVRGGGGSRGGRRSEYQGVTGLKALGVRDLTYKLMFVATHVQPLHSSVMPGPTGPSASGVKNQSDGPTAADFTKEEKQRIWEMKNAPELYKHMVNSVAPTVFGHIEIKRGILLMLFGGVHKRTKDKSSLRGDINVCIVGDPSTSKSQFLKYVVGFLPRAVYTSGKASSAAGLTASVIKDPETGEFTIEAGALMLADNSICCIDEFDKMDVVDQTAIHEAMEQQTISITKAGIQATLNARTSILAAANPIKGRYDRSRTLKQNVDISAPIMSRFDLFYVVLDEGDELIDFNIARHIIKVHMNQEEASHTPFSIEDLQLYIRFARLVKPQITPKARKLFVRKYLELRGQDAAGPNRTSYRITVRQLESMVRLSEALARLHLDEWVRPEYVVEAARLLQMSIIHVDAPEVDLSVFMDDDEDDEDGDDDDDQDEDGDEAMGVVEEELKGKKKKKQEKKKRKKKKKKKGKKSVVKISYEEYMAIANRLVLHMRRQEEASVEAVMRKSDLVAWFLMQQEEAGNITTQADLSLQTRKINSIINRLVLEDHVLIEVLGSEEHREGGADPDSAAGVAPESDPLLQVHPNYDPDAQDLDALELLPEDEDNITKLYDVLGVSRGDEEEAGDAAQSKKRKKADGEGEGEPASSPKRAKKRSPTKKKKAASPSKRRSTDDDSDEDMS